MIKAGIAGGAGYTAGELLRILIYHPSVQIKFVHSNSNAGKTVTEVHRDLLGETSLMFTNDFNNDIDVLFLCMGHGKSKEFIQNHSLPQSIKIIDLSRDFRLKPTSGNYIYGLPELNKEKIEASGYIANPGCFATSIQLALLPLAEARLLSSDIHVNAITGSTGAGQNPSATTHFSWRNNNISIYKAFQHQHLDEIYQSIGQLQPGYTQKINFIPMRGNFTRGIFASSYTDCSLSEAEAIYLYEHFYDNDPFVIVSRENPHLKQVVNTNKCILYLQKHDNKLLIVSMIDNLIKGASGQAVHNMNLMFGLEESAGLGLKAVAF